MTSDTTTNSQDNQTVTVYTTREAGKILKLHYETVRQFIRDGRLKAVNISSTDRPIYRVTLAHINEFLGGGLSEK